MGNRQSGRIDAMNVRIIGAGAVGSVVAWKLYRHADMAFIVDEERSRRYADGLIVNGERIRFSLLTPSQADRADLLIFAVKNFQLDNAMDEAAPFIGDSTVILPLLNGIEAEAVLSERFGAEKVLYGFITDLSSTHSGVETICFSKGGNIIFGERNNVVSERVRDITRLFDEAGQKYSVPDDILHEKWWKFMLNTCFNTISAILEADYAAISSNGPFIRAVRLIAREVQRVGAAEGVTISQEDIEEMIRRVTALRDHGKTSMLQDVLAGRETENRYFAGAVSRLGKLHSIPTPLSDFMAIMLEAKRSARASV